MTDFSQSRFAACLQELVAQRREAVGLYAEVIDLIQAPSDGRLLEVGCGSGRQLKVLHARHPGLELFGLELSAAALNNARRNLEGLRVDLRQGSIESTEYEQAFFDRVTCFSSMSYWQNLATCFDEIFRILKPGGCARLVEPWQDIDLEQVVETVKANLAGESWLRRTLAANLNRFGLKHGRKVGLRLYSTDELAQTISESRFGESYAIEQASIQDLPIFMLITMTKAG